MIAENVTQLFGTAPGPAYEIPLRVLRRGGEPFLYVPCETRLAAAALDLYSAQSPLARLARTALRTTWAAGIPLPLESVALQVPEESPLLKYLAAVSGTPRPRFAILAGNPRASGQRFLFLIFGPDGRPRWVVKAGATPEARALVAAEVRVLKDLPRDTPGRPAIHVEMLDGETIAFALPFIDGASPRVPMDDPTLASLLSAWVDEQREVSLPDLAVWPRFQAVAQSLDPAAVRQPFHPTIFHGDFAPSNVKVRTDSWVVLDWERGELTGPPAWDWFHFVVLPAVLVDRCPAHLVRRKLASLLATSAFSKYAARAAIVGRETMLARAYLLYCAEVLRPTERSEVFQELGATSESDLSPPR